MHFEWLQSSLQDIHVGDEDDGHSVSAVGSSAPVATLEY